MQEISILGQMAAFYGRLAWEEIPKEVIEKAKLCLLDVLECCQAAPLDRRMKGALGSVSKYKTDAGAIVWGEDFCLWARDAAFANAVRGSLSYRNDLHRNSAVHGGAVACAAAIAAAEEYQVLPSQALLGIVAGYDAMIRLGETLSRAGLPKGYRSSAVCAAFGAAIAAGKTMGLPVRELASAASFACHGAGGNNQWAASGTGEDVFQAGWGARNGVEAAELAGAGALGCLESLEGEDGLLTCLGAGKEAGHMLEELGKRFCILEVEHKPVEACLMLQTPCQAAETLREQKAICPQEVEKIFLYVAGQAKKQPGCDCLRIENSVQAKMNLRYGVAQTLYRRNTWDKPDERMQNLIEKIQVLEEPAFTRQFPGKVPARLQIWAGGHCFEEEAEDFRPLPPEGVRERFAGTCRRELGAERAEKILKAVDCLENLGAMEHFTGFLKR